MTRLTTLGKVSERVAELSKDCVDRLTVVKGIQFDSIETVRIDSEQHAMRPVAQQEMACRLGIPIQYLRKCPAEVQAYNFNHWIAKERHEKLLFRFDNEEVRAVFTPRYKPADHFEVLERLDSIGYGPETEVQCGPG